MADGVEALRVAILFVGWPGMAVISSFVLWNAWQFRQRVQGSPFGHLVFVMVVGWTLTMGFLAFLGSLFLQSDPDGAGVLMGAFLGFWTFNMALIVWIVHRWGAAAVHINLYYTELVAMDRVKNQLINTIAHELNTPLTPVLLRVHMLREGKFGPLGSDQTEALLAIERSLARLQLLIDQVVLATQIQAENLGLAITSNRVKAWIEDACAPFMEQAKQEGRRLTVEAPDADALFDRPRMHRVLASLVDNALRYSKPGTLVKVVGSLRTPPGREQEVVVEVTDLGRGVTAEQASVVFQPFAQGIAGPADGREGAGLSLFVAHGIVAAHGGRMWVRSEGRDKGSTFGFSIPTEPVLSPASRSSTGVPTSLSGPSAPMSL